MTSAELHQVITADGITYTLNTNSRISWLLTPTPGLWGLPPINYVRDQVYKGDGQIDLGYYLQTRQFSVEVKANACSRQEYWQLRQDILNILRPNRNGQLTYIFRRPDQRQFAIVARAVGDPLLGTNPDEWLEWGYQGNIDFEAVDPTWFNPTLESATGTNPSQAELVFPITFDDDGIVFGDASLVKELIIVYDGTWREYPVFTVTGPLSTITLTHVEKGVRLVWTGVLDSGETLTINLQNGYVNGQYVGWFIVDSNGNDEGNLLTTDSDLMNLALWPGSELGNDGTNTIQFSALEVDGNTQIAMAYHTRYIGI